MLTVFTTYDGLLLVVILYLLNKLVRQAFSPRDTIPPGPPGTLLVGNTFQIPASRQWLKFDEWIKEYGECQRESTFG